MRKQLFTILLQIGYKTVGMPRGNWMIVRVPIYRASRDVYGETKDGGKWKILFCSVGEDSGYKNPHQSEFVEKPIWLLSDQRHPEAVIKKACLLIFCSTFLPTYLPPYHSKYYGSQYCVKLIAIERKKESIILLEGKLSLYLCTWVLRHVLT